MSQRDLSVLIVSTVLDTTRHLELTPSTIIPIILHSLLSTLLQVLCSLCFDVPCSLRIYAVIRRRQLFQFSSFRKKNSIKLSLPQNSHNSRHSYERRADLDLCQVIRQRKH